VKRTIRTFTMSYRGTNKVFGRNRADMGAFYADGPRAGQPLVRVRRRCSLRAGRYVFDEKSGTYGFCSTDSPHFFSVTTAIDT
jgi:hypothetical protein